MPFKILKKQNLPYKLFFIFYILIAAILVTTAVLMTALTGDLASAAENMNIEAIIHFISFLAIIMLARTAAFSFEAYILRKRYANISYKVRENFIKSLSLKPFRKIENESAGEALSIFSNDLPQSNLLISYSIFRIVLEVLSVLTIFIYMLSINIFMTFIFFATFPILSAVQVMASLPIQKKAKVMSEKTAAFNEIVVDSLQNTTIITSFGLEEKLEERYLKSYDEFINSLKSYIKTFAWLVIGGIMFSLIPQIAIILWAALNVINGYMYLGQFVAFTSFVFIAGSFIMMLTQMLSVIQSQTASAKRLDEHILNNKQDLPNIKKFNTEDDIAIKVTNLTFEDIIKNNDDKGLSFEIKKGSKTAIVGVSGSGKSTLLKLLLGLYVGKGDIEINGEVAYVPQNSFLFPESIAKNIAGENIDREKLELASKEAGILDFINSLEKGFETVLTERAENISGGQKQRIALARAFYTEAPIILFDEATSALDEVTEASILEDLSKTNKTIVIVAHRESVILFCDNIIKLKKGDM
ncbi:MAG: ABC transporter ATP-binding protein/permease [Defluviitaleaceae bacterium]|nr:ABC transporter ATP-binding protein/permease [Defluviitaleaceae bacterium]